MRISKWFMVAALAFALVTLAGCGTNYNTTGTVIEKSYEPDSTSYGFGGKNTKVYYTPPKRTLVIQLETGEAIEKDVDLNTYVSVKPGDKVDVQANSVWGVFEIKKQETK